MLVFKAKEDKKTKDITEFKSFGALYGMYAPGAAQPELKLTEDPITMEPVYNRPGDPYFKVHRILKVGKEFTSYNTQTLIDLRDASPTGVVTDPYTRKPIKYAVKRAVQKLVWAGMYPLTHAQVTDSFRLRILRSFLTLLTARNRDAIDAGDAHARARAFVDVNTLHRAGVVFDLEPCLQELSRAAASAVGTSSAVDVICCCFLLALLFEPLVSLECRNVFFCVKVLLFTTR